MIIIASLLLAAFQWAPFSRGLAAPTEERGPASLGTQKRTKAAKPARKVASKTPVKRPHQYVKMGRLYEFDISSDGQRVSLEENIIDGRPAYFVEQRRGKKKVIALLSVDKKQYDAWAAELDSVLESRSDVKCDRAERIYRRSKGQVKTLVLCNGQLSPTPAKKLARIKSDVLAMFKKTENVKRIR